MLFDMLVQSKVKANEQQDSPAADKTRDSNVSLKNRPEPGVELFLPDPSHPSYNHKWNPIKAIAGGVKMLGELNWSAVFPDRTPHPWFTRPKDMPPDPEALPKDGETKEQAQKRYEELCAQEMQKLTHLVKTAPLPKVHDKTSIADSNPKTDTSTADATANQKSAKMPK